MDFLEAEIASNFIFGSDLLYSGVSLAVSIILFEGCMSLKIKEIKGVEKVVRNLVTVGLLMTAVVTTILVRFMFDFPWGVAALLGAITSVSGPTVVVPILRSIRPTRKLESVIKWEGMLIDPIGALLAALVFTAIINFSKFEAVTEILLHILGVIILGIGLGLAGGYFIGTVLRKHWVPDYLRNLFVLSIVVFVFSIADYAVEGAGLLAVTIMGIFVGNVWENYIDEVVDFKEHLSVLLISVLFIILSANISFENLEKVIVPAVILIVLLQCVLRPCVVMLCAWGSDLNWRERLLLGWVFPRGIVVAAVVALFSAKLIAMGTAEYEYYGHILSLLAFLIIIGTVLIPSLTAPYLAKLLGVAEPDQNGFLIIGANTLAIEVAKALREENIPVVLADEKWSRASAARLEGLKCYYGNPATEHADWHIDMVGIGKVLGLSEDHQVNTLSAIKYYHELSSDAIFILPSNTLAQNQQMTLLDKRYGKRLFSEDKDYKAFKLLMPDSSIKCTKITEDFTWLNYLESYKNQKIEVLPLFSITPKGKVHVFSPDTSISVVEGWRVIALVSNE